MNIKELRKQAIKRYENGESPKEIYQSLGKGKTWFFKWFKRYKLDGEDWTKSHFCRPIKVLVPYQKALLIYQGSISRVRSCNITFHIPFRFF